MKRQSWAYVGINLYHYQCQYEDADEMNDYFDTYQLQPTSSIITDAKSAFQPTWAVYDIGM